MTLTHPLAMWLLPLIALPPLIARRRRPRKRRVVSNLYLWENLIPQGAARLTARRFSRRWIVALQMLIIATVVVALGRPAVAVSGRRAALVIDASASMGAKTGSGTRLDLARERARTVIGTLPRQSLVHIVAAGPSPHDLGEYAAGDSRLPAILDSIAETAGVCDLSDAITVATGGDTSVGSLYVISDRSRPANGQLSNSDPLVARWDRVGEPVDNFAITALAARHFPLTPKGGEVLAEVANYASRDRTVAIELSRNGAGVLRQTIQIPRHERRHILVMLDDIEGVIGAHLLADDGLASDNERVTVVPPTESIRVAVVSADSFLARALTSNHSIEVQRGRPMAEADVAVCEGCSALPDTPAGILMVAGSAPDADAQLLTIANPHHPIAASLDLDPIAVSMAADAPLGDRGEVVFRAGGRPAVVADERGGRRIVEIRFTPATSELRFDPSFPVLVANAIGWLSGRADNALDVVAGNPLVWRLPGIANASVAGPDGRPIPSRLTAGSLSVDDTSMPGVYVVKTATQTRRFVVNTATETESDLSDDPQTVTADRTIPTAPVQRQLAPWLLLFGTALLVIEWWYRRGPTSRRIATIGILFLAALDISIPAGVSAITAVAVLDRSESVVPAAQIDHISRVNRFGASMHAGDRLGIVMFGADAVIERQPSDHVHIDEIRSSVDDSGTNVAAGLRLAGALVRNSESKRLVLLSDGRENVEHAEREAARAAAAGVSIDVVPVDVTNRQIPLVPTRLNVTKEVDVDRPFTVGVDVEGPPQSRGHLRIYRDDDLLAEREVRVGAHGVGSVAVTDRVTGPGTHTYRAILQPDDDFADQPSEVGAVVLVAGRPSVLCVFTSRCSLSRLLSENGFRVVSVRPEALPDTASGLAGYEAVLLDDVAPDILRSRQTAAVVEYVERLGGGALILGGPRSLTVEDYASTALGSILPVDLRPRHGARTPALGLVLAFDKSGSMADLTSATSKIEFARRAAISLLDVLPSTDHFGVIAFDSTPAVVAPLGPGHDRHELAERLRAVAAGGSTQLAPAVQMATEWLNNDPSISRRQILIVSDGRTSDDDAARLLSMAGMPGIEISAVAIGENADVSLLRRVAGSRGRVYVAADISELPRIVAREASRSTAGTVVQEPVALKAGAHPTLSGIEVAALPSIGGYVVSAAKPSATSVLSSSLGDPILCLGRSGLGRTGVFTGDLESAWSASMFRWRQNAQLWTQVARWLQRQPFDRRMAIDVVDHDGPLLVVVASAADGRSLNLNQVRATVRTPAGETTDLSLNAVEPGHYEVHLPTAASGPYVIDATGIDEDSGVEHHVVSGVYWAADRERAARGADLNFLRRLAELSGGRVLGAGDSPFAGARPRRRSDLSPLLTTIALLLFVVDLLVQRRLHVKHLRWWRRRPEDGAQNSKIRRFSAPITN